MPSPKTGDIVVRPGQERPIRLLVLKVSDRDGDMTVVRVNKDGRRRKGCVPFGTWAGRYVVEQPTEPRDEE